MATMFKKGTIVRLKVPVIEGPVLKLHVIDDDKIHYLVQYKDELGNVQEGVFPEAKLEEVPKT